jgi:hypothetical protein
LASRPLGAISEESNTRRAIGGKGSRLSSRLSATSVHGAGVSKVVGAKDVAGWRRKRKEESISGKEGGSMIKEVIIAEEEGVNERAREYGG